MNFLNVHQLEIGSDSGIAYSTASYGTADLCVVRKLYAVKIQDSRRVEEKLNDIQHIVLPRTECFICRYGTRCKVGLSRGHRRREKVCIRVGVSEPFSFGQGFRRSAGDEGGGGCRSTGAAMVLEDGAGDGYAEKGECAVGLGARIGGG